MAEKKEVLLDSIAKLLGMRVSDEEIIYNLKSVGVGEKESRVLLEEAKQRVFGGGRDEDSLQEQIEDLSSGVESKPSRQALAYSGKPPKESSLESRDDILELWEKGIMATVNSKLLEMEKIKKSIDDVVDSKVQAGLEKEVKKIDTVFDSQRRLSAQSMREEVESKTREIEQLLDAKIAELSKLNSASTDYLARFEAQVKSNETVLAEMNSRLGEFNNLKSVFVSKMNSDFLESKSKVDAFLQEADKKHKETVDRINRSLELETKIVEGLVNDAKQKIDGLTLESSSKFQGDLSARFESMKKELDKKTAKLEEFAKKIDLFAQSASSRFEGQMNARFEEQKKSLDKKIRQLEDVEKRIDVDAIRATMEELDVFKQQFANQIKNNVDSFNDAKRELTDLINEREKLIDKQLGVLSQKLTEFEAFEDRFANEIGLKVDRMFEKKKSQVAAKK